MSALLGALASIAAAFYTVVSARKRRAERLRLKDELQRTESERERLQKTVEAMKSAAEIHEEAVRAGIAGIADDLTQQHDHKFGPVEAAIRQTMNVLGRLLNEIGEVYPDNAKLAELHKIEARELRKIAAELQEAPPRDQHVPLTCGFIGGSPNLLSLLTENLLKPIADLRKGKATEEAVRTRAAEGVLTIAKRLENDGELLERGL